MFPLAGVVLPTSTSASEFSMVELLLVALFTYIHIYSLNFTDAVQVSAVEAQDQPATLLCTPLQEQGGHGFQLSVETFPSKLPPGLQQHFRILQAAMVELKTRDFLGCCKYDCEIPVAGNHPDGI